jgi:bacterioferritin
MKGNPKVIDYLNKALRHELTAVNQYWLHYRMLDNWGILDSARPDRRSIRTHMHSPGSATKYRLRYRPTFPIDDQGSSGIYRSVPWSFLSNLSEQLFYPT